MTWLAEHSKRTKRYLLIGNCVRSADVSWFAIRSYVILVMRWDSKGAPPTIMRGIERIPVEKGRLAYPLPLKTLQHDSIAIFRVPPVWRGRSGRDIILSTMSTVEGPAHATEDPSPRS